MDKQIKDMITFFCNKRKGYPEGNIRVKIKWANGSLCLSIGYNWNPDKWHKGNPIGVNLAGLKASEAMKRNSEFAEKVADILRAQPFITANDLRRKLQRRILSNDLYTIAKSYCNSHSLASSTIDAILSLTRQWTRLGFNIVTDEAVNLFVTKRRSFICNLIAEGISIEVIMAMTGHQSYESIRPYIGIGEDTKREALNALMAK